MLRRPLSHQPVGPQVSWESILDRLDHDGAGILAWFLLSLGATGETDLQIVHERLNRLSPDARLEYVLEHARRVGALPANARVSAVEQQISMLKAKLTALFRYEAPPFSPTGMLLLRPADCGPGDLSRHDPDPTLGWNEFCPGRLQQHVAPGNHYSMLSEPHVRDLARFLSAYLDEGVPNTSTGSSGLAAR